MPQGAKIPAEVHWIVIRLASRLDKAEIAIYTGISLHSVEKILRYFERNGTIQVRESEQQRRKRLRDLDVEVNDTLFIHGSCWIKLTVSAWDSKTSSRYVPRRAPGSSVFDMWRWSVSGNSMEDITESWFDNEESEFCLLEQLLELTDDVEVTRLAAERSAEKRLDYISRISKYEPHQLVFVDESSVDRRTAYRGWAWSIRGTQAQQKAFFVRGRR
jgi:hypothetical protein